MKRLIPLILFVVCFFQLVQVGAQEKSAFKLPPYEKLVLKNGLTLYLMEQHEVPLINIAAIVHAGAIYDESKSGLASLTASMLMNGTKRLTKNKLEEELDFTGADVYTYATKEAVNLNAKFSSKDVDTVLALIKQIILTPAFDATEFDKEKKMLLAQLEQAKESPRNVIGDYFNQVLFGSHVYANPARGRVSTVAKLTVQDVQKFYRAHYMPNGAALAIAGDFKTADMRRKLTEHFSGWVKGVASTSVLTKLIPTATTHVLLVNKDDANETTFMIGGPGVPRSNPDYVAVEVVNTVFGGRFTSWLNDELRVNTGLTYGASSSFNRLKAGGTFQISTYTATKNTEAAIDKALEVLNKLHTAGIDDTALTSAKNYVKGGFPPRFETAAQLADLLRQMFWYGFDESFINTFQQTVDQLTVAKAKEIIATYFPKKNLQFVMVGKADTIRKLAAKYGPVTEVKLKDDAVKSF